jgi:polygalacturonase
MLPILLLFLVGAALTITVNSAMAMPQRDVCDAISDFGAVGDNITEDTYAVQQALLSCSTVILRSNHTFLLRPLQLISHRHLVIDGTIAAWRDIKTWPNSTNKDCSITPYLDPHPKVAPQKEALLWGVPPLSNVTIAGQGTVDGQGWRWWRLKNNTSHGDYWHNCRPHLLFLGLRNVTMFGSVQDVVVSDVYFKDPPFWTLAGRGLRNVTFRNVTIKTVGCGYEEAPNTDGFNLQGENLLVEDSFVRNGDDCVPIFPPSKNVIVRNITCSCGNPPVVVIWPASNYNSGQGKQPYFAGNVENVSFDMINLQGTSAGLAIKSLQPFVGQAKQIHFTNFQLENVKIGVAINFFHQGTIVKSQEEIDSNIIFKGSASSIFIENVSGTVQMNAGHIDCLGSEPCKNIHLSNVQLSDVNGGVLKEGYSCMNSSGVATNCQPFPCGWKEALNVTQTKIR